MLLLGVRCDGFPPLLLAVEGRSTPSWPLSADLGSGGRGTHHGVMGWGCRLENTNRKVLHSHYREGTPILPRIPPMTIHAALTRRAHVLRARLSAAVRSRRHVVNGSLFEVFVYKVRAHCGQKENTVTTCPVHPKAIFYRWSLLGQVTSKLPCISQLWPRPRRAGHSPYRKTHHRSTEASLPWSTNHRFPGIDPSHLGLYAGKVFLGGTSLYVLRS